MRISTNNDALALNEHWAVQKIRETAVLSIQRCFNAHDSNS